MTWRVSVVLVFAVLATACATLTELAGGAGEGGRCPTPPPPPPDGQCVAVMSPQEPQQNGNVTLCVYDAPAGATIAATAHYKSKDTAQQGLVQPDGTGEVTFAIGGATIGHVVGVDVDAGGETCAASFIPR